MMEMDLITGQIVARDAAMNKASDLTHNPQDDRKIVAVVGIIAVPQESLRGEHQYIVSGKMIPDLNVLSLAVMLSTAEDVSKISRGAALGHLVIEPIWRI